MIQLSSFSAATFKLNSNCSSSLISPRLGPEQCSRNESILQIRRRLGLGANKRPPGVGKTLFSHEIAVHHSSEQSPQGIWQIESFVFQLPQSVD